MGHDQYHAQRGRHHGRHHSRRPRAKFLVCVASGCCKFRAKTRQGRGSISSPRYPPLYTLNDKVKSITPTTSKTSNAAPRHTHTQDVRLTQQNNEVRHETRPATRGRSCETALPRCSSAAPPCPDGRRARLHARARRRRRRTPRLLLLLVPLLISRSAAFAAARRSSAARPWT